MIRFGKGLVVPGEPASPASNLLPVFHPLMRVCLYTRTSSDDAKETAVLGEQGDLCRAFAARAGMEIVREFTDDGATGTTPMHSRPQGKQMIAALLTEAIQIVVTYDAVCVGRTQRVFRPFLSLCRDNGIVLLDCNGNDLSESAIAGIDGRRRRQSRESAVERMAAGKRKLYGVQRTDGRWPYGEHPRLEYAGERDVIERIQTMRAEGMSLYRIAKILTNDGVRTRYDKEFKGTQVGAILARAASSPDLEVLESPSTRISLCVDNPPRETVRQRNLA